MWTALALAAAVLTAPAMAEEPPLPVLRLATCAALWHATAQVIGDDGDRALAEHFLSKASRLGGKAEARALVEERRPWMVDLLHAYIGSGDDQSRDLYDRLLSDCAILQADLP